MEVCLVVLTFRSVEEILRCDQSYKLTVNWLFSSTFTWFYLLNQWMKFCGVTASGTSPKRPRWGQKKVAVVGRYVWTVRQKRDRCREVHVVVSGGSTVCSAFPWYCLFFMLSTLRFTTRLDQVMAGLSASVTLNVSTQTSLVELLYCTILLLGF